MKIAKPREETKPPLRVIPWAVLSQAPDTYKSDLQFLNFKRVLSKWEMIF